MFTNDAVGNQESKHHQGFINYHQRHMKQIYKNEEENWYG